MYKSIWLLVQWLVFSLGFAEHLAEPKLSLVSVALGETVNVDMPEGSTLTRVSLDYPTTTTMQVGGKFIITAIPSAILRIDPLGKSFVIPTLVTKNGDPLSELNFEDSRIGKDFNIVRGGIHSLSLTYRINGQNKRKDTYINIIGRSTEQVRLVQPRFDTILVWYSSKSLPSEARLRSFIGPSLQNRGVTIDSIKIIPLGGGSDLCDQALALIKLGGSGTKNFGNMLNGLRHDFDAPRDLEIVHQSRQDTSFRRWEITQNQMKINKPIWRVDPYFSSRVLYHDGYHPGPDEDWDIHNLPKDIKLVEPRSRVEGQCVLYSEGDPGPYMFCPNIQVAILDTAGKLVNGRLVPTEVARDSDVEDPFDPVYTDENGQEHHFSIGHGKPIGWLVKALTESATPPTGPGPVAQPILADTRIVPTYIAVCQADGICFDSDIVQGVCAALREYKSNKNVDDTRNPYRGLILNLSFGTYDPSPVLKEILKEASQEHRVIVAAAAGNWGNEAPDVTLYPAAYDLPGIVAVGSLYRKLNNEGWQRSPTSMKGEMYAPGRGVLAHFSGNQWYYYNGTSFAAPWVAAALARYRSKFPSAMPESIVQCLFSNSGVTNNVQDIGDNTIGLLTRDLPNNC